MICTVILSFMTSCSLRTQYFASQEQFCGLGLQVILKDTIKVCLNVYWFWELKCSQEIKRCNFSPQSGFFRKRPYWYSFISTVNAAYILPGKQKSKEISLLDIQSTNADDMNSPVLTNKYSAVRSLCEGFQITHAHISFVNFGSSSTN